MSLTVSQFGRYDIFAIKGRLTILELPHCAPELSRYVQSNTGRHFGLDLSAAELLDSSALRLLINLKKHADTNKVDFILLAPSDSVLQIIKGTNLDKVFRILSTLGELEALIASDFIRKYAPYTTQANGVTRISLTCAVCGSTYVSGYLVDQSAYSWEWKGNSMHPVATAADTGQVVDVYSILPVACSECYMCSLDISLFNVTADDHIAIHSTLDDATKSLLTKSIKKRKKIIDDLGVAVGERFFEHPRNTFSTYGIYLLAECCAQTMAARKSSTDAFGIGYMSYLASKYAPPDQTAMILGNSRTWLTLALTEKQSCTPLQVSQAMYILIVAAMKLSKMKDASKMHAEFDLFMEGRPTTNAGSINDPAFWYTQAKALWQNQIDDSVAAFKAG